MILAIDGFGASGKSQLAAALAPRLNAHVVALDDFTQPGTSTWEHDRVIAEVISPLHRGADARYRPWRYDWDQPGDELLIPAGSSVIVEGVSALALEVVNRIGRWWDVSIWVDAPEDVRRARIAKRDGDALLPLWERHWWPSERAYFQAERPDLRADIVLGK